MSDEPLPDDLPPHKIGATEHRSQVGIPRPLAGSTVHFVDRGTTQCRAAMVVQLLEEQPLDPEFRVDVVIFAPRREVSRTDRFTRANNLPGNVRWANNLLHAPVEENRELTWHWPSAGCVPKVGLD